MMKLKHLFANTDLAQMLLCNWDIARGQEPHIEHFRSSANAVYTLSCGAGTFFLRIAPLEEKSPESVEAELDFLCYLREQGYPAARSVPAADGKAFVTADTPWGVHSMTVFEKALGMPMEQITCSKAVYEGFGQSLRRLHRLSRGYQPPGTARTDWRERLDWCARMAAEYGADLLVLSEARLIGDALNTLPRTPDNYGLVHYDFELDNVFYDADHGFTAIDFDDAMYHWYALDVAQSVESIREEVPGAQRESAVSSFLSGYQTEMPLDAQAFASMPVFTRFVNLYGYVRCLRCAREHWDNEPQWMLDLRGRLDRAMEKRRTQFGQPLSL